MYGMTTLAPSINFPVNGFGFFWFSVRGGLVERTVLGSGCLVGLCEGDPFLFARNSGVGHTCLALWIRVWMTDCFAEMGWLEL